MPPRLDTPVLTVDVGLIHKVDTRNVENLFSMWSVFSKCASSLEEGRRLENLSWRLWNRETFCCEPGEANATTPAISISSRSSEGRYSASIPDLSGSVESVDDEAIEFDGEDDASRSAPLDIVRPRIQRQDSGSTRSRGRERHITPDDLEKMVITIKEKKDLEPLSISLHSQLPPLIQAPQAPQASPEVPDVVEREVATSASPAIKPAQAASDSGSSTSERSTTSIVRGFSPSHVSSSYRSIPLPTAPSSLPDAALAPSSTRANGKKQTMFALGGSSQSGDDSYNEPSSLESRIRQSQQQIKKKANIFQLGASSGEDDGSLRDSMHSVAPSIRSSLADGRRAPQKKQTSFMEEIATRTIHEDQVMDDDVFETDDEDEVGESAIDDDDDSSEWEDSIEDSGKSSVDEKPLFQRVDSRPNLTSRRSMLTTMLHQNDRAAALSNIASKSTPAMHRSRTSSPRGPSVPASPDSEDGAPLMMKKGHAPGQQVPRSAAQPIIMTTTNSSAHQAALSPKTTRRNMLATELTASLRRHLLWERQQKNQTATAVLKRRHTAHDVANLKQYPEKVHIGTGDNDSHASWNQYFGQGLGEYHSKGW
ncbi:MAG: hypothetical protein M1818_006048 [Claussenomyces sp. TS43310]|nr:MAG: hypothetical protein M1818_006048 [Claussenomyces sp. TS43310]